MPLNLQVVIDDEDIARFRRLTAQLEKAEIDARQRHKIVNAAADLLHNARQRHLSGFIEERLQKLEVLLNMIRDEQWQLDEQQEQAIVAALAYFVEDNDLIADQIPGLGFLDDAIYIELVLREFEKLLQDYSDFCQLRIGRSFHQRNNGEDHQVKREDWLADKRTVLHSHEQGCLPDESEASTGSGSVLF